MIRINTPISEITNLSAKANTVLNWIPGADVWLSNAIDDTSVSYHFASETALIQSILTGLYSTEQIAIKANECLASPEFLMLLTSDQLTQIGTVPDDSSDSSDSIHSTLSELDIIGGSQISSVNTVLKEWQLDQHFIFQNLSTEALRQLLKLERQVANTQYDTTVLNAGLSFALDECVCATSFAVLMRVAINLYQTLFSENSAKRVTATVKNKFAKTYRTLSSLAANQLACPQLRPPQTAGDVGQVLNLWGTSKRFVGFTDLPTGVLLLASNIDLSDLLKGKNVDSLYSSFEQNYFNFLNQAKVTKQVLSQDSKYWYYQVASHQYTAEFQLAEDGCLTLSAFSSSNKGN